MPNVLSVKAKLYFPSKVSWGPVESCVVTIRLSILIKKEHGDTHLSLNSGNEHHIREFKQTTTQRQREHHQTKGLTSRKMVYGNNSNSLFIVTTPQNNGCARAL